jgi:WD40 repeat protein/serine/threonine protein kinase
MHPEEAPSTLPFSVLAEIHRLTKSFAAELRARRAPRIEDSLRELGGEGRGQLLLELLALEIDDRRRRDETVSIGDYAQRFPAEKKVIEQALELRESTSAEERGPRDHDLFADALAVKPSAARDDDAESRKDLEAAGPYSVRGRLGAGGMGVVYLAEETGPVKRRVAVKVIKLGMDTREVIARFEAERQALALMSHSHIAKVFAAGSTPRGRPFFVMEYVAGEPITDYCDRHRLSTRERLELFVPICEAVLHAHQKAIIHRDLKPSNVLVTLEDGRPVPKVIDFGVAKALNQRLTEASFFTEFGRLIGTPAYMSPEQAEMGALDIDTRTDVYSLGVLLYELLTGALPFDTKRLCAAGYDEMRRMIREEETPRPSTRFSGLGETSKAIAEHRRTDPARLSSELRGELDWITIRAMEKDRTRRYATPAELAADIERHLRHEAVLAGPPSAAYRVKKFVQRYRVPVVATAAVIVALVVGLVTTAVLYQRAETEKSEKETALGKLGAALGDLQRESSEKSGLIVELDKESRAKSALIVEKDSLVTTLREETAAKDRAIADKTSALEEKAAELIRSDGLRLVNHSTSTRSENPGLALLLAIEAAERAPGLLANNALLDALGDLRERRTFGMGDVRSADASLDGRRVVTVHENGTARIWDVASGAELIWLSNVHQPVFRATTAIVRILSSMFPPVSPLQSLIALDILSGLYGFGESNTTAAISSDGSRVLTASHDGLVRVWEAESGETMGAADSGQFVQVLGFSTDGSRVLIATMLGSALSVDAMQGSTLPGLKLDSITSVAQSPDGRRIVTVSKDQTASVWDTTSGEEILRLGMTPSSRGSPGEFRTLRPAAFSPDGRRVFAAIDDSKVRIWDAVDGSELATLDEDQGWFVDVAFSPDGNRVITASSEEIVRIWNVATRSELARLRGHSAEITCVAFSPGGGRVRTGSEDDTARIWDAFSGVELTTLRGHKAAVESAVFLRHATQIFTVSKDGTARIWDVASYSESATLERHGLKAHSYVVRSASFSPDGNRVLTVCREVAFQDTARVWDIASGAEIKIDGPVPALHDFSERTFFGLSAVFSPNGDRILTAEFGGTAQIWSSSSGGEIATLDGHVDGVHSAVFSPDGGRVLTASQDGTARIWDAGSGAELATLTGHSGAVYSARFDPRGERILTESEDETARIWDAASGAELAVLSGHTPYARRSVFSPDGRRLLVGSEDHTARIWDTASGAELRTLTGHSGAVLSAVFSPDGSRALTASEDKSARIWDATSGSELVKLKGHSDAIHSAIYSPDGSRIVTVSDNKTARIWDAGSGVEFATLRGLPRLIRSDLVSTSSQTLPGSVRRVQGLQASLLSADFSPDGQRVLTVAGDQVRIWPVDPLAAAIARKPRNLTSGETRHYEIRPRKEVSISAESESEPATDR